MMKIINDELLDTLSDAATTSGRLRMNFNLHENLDDHVQKLLNALEPGTIMPVHRHVGTAETYFVLRGSLIVLLYNDQRELIEKCELNPLKGCYGVDIPAGQWHSIEVLEKGTAIFEVKQGPYMPLKPEDSLE